MKQDKFRRWIFALLALGLLASGCGGFGSHTQEQEACNQIAKNFQPGSGSQSLIQASRPYNGLDQGAWALSPLPDGSLVVGGDFTAAGAIQALHVARWDPAAQEWSALGEGLPDPVRELVSTPQGSIFASTLLVSNSSAPFKFKLFRWTNGTWQLISDPLIGGSTSFGTIETMVWDGKEGFYLGGRFGALGGLAVNGIIHWDGNTWSSLPGSLPLPGLFTTLALATGPGGRLYAGGILKTDADVGTNRVFAWNGETWTALGGPLPGQVESLAVSAAGQLAGVIVRHDIPLASGQSWGWSSLGFDASRQEWTPIDSGFPALSKGFKILLEYEKVGFGPPTNAMPANEMAAWEGSLWQARSDPYQLEYDKKRPARVYVLAGKVYALGAFEQMGGAQADNIAAWDGRAWQSLSGAIGLQPGGIAGKVDAIVVDGRGVVTVGGDFKIAGDIQASNIARWDGKAWQPLGSGTDGEVLALAVGLDGHIYAGGNFSTAGGKEAFGLAEWNPISKEWTPLADRQGPGFSYVVALAVAPDGGLYAAAWVSGNYKIYAWDGKQWQDLPGSFNDQIWALHVDQQGRLFAGGAFASVDGAPANGLARWDTGSGSWVNLGAGLGWVSSFPLITQLLDAPDGSLYVGGNFISLDGQPFCHVARLDISRGAPDWELPGGGLPWLCRMALGADGRLYAVSILLRDHNSQSDYQAVFLAPGQDNWQLLGGMIGRRDSFTQIGALTASTDGRLYLGGQFDQIDGQPARSFTVFHLPGD